MCRCSRRRVHVIGRGTPVSNELRPLSESTALSTYTMTLPCSFLSFLTPPLFYNFLTLSLSPSFTHLCDVDQVRDRSLDTVASAFDLGFDQRHLVPVERVFNRPIDVDFFRHDDVLQIVLGGGRGSGRDHGCVCESCDDSPWWSSL